MIHIYLRLYTAYGSASPSIHSFASAIPPWVIAKVASFSGRSGLKMKARLLYNVH